ncbi:unnamed protein product, partial [Pleuronectes platessa]
RFTSTAIRVLSPPSTSRAPPNPLPYRGTQQASQATLTTCLCSRCSPPPRCSLMSACQAAQAMMRGPSVSFSLPLASRLSVTSPFPVTPCLSCLLGYTGPPRSSEDTRSDNGEISARAAAHRHMHPVDVVQIDGGTIISRGTTITHPPQRTVPQNPHENAPVPLAAPAPPTGGPSTERGGVCGRHSRANSLVASTQPVPKHCHCFRS